MGKTLLVSLVSDQTIPNVRLINEFKDQVDDYLFLTTGGMENKGCRKWIENTTKITALDPIVVNEFSVDDIIAKLDKFDFSVYSKLIVNLTGGTKVMTLAAHDYFKEEGADIYYITGRDNDYLKIFPGKKKIQYSFKSKMSIFDYLTAYGFEIEQTRASGIPYEYTCKLFEKFCNGDLDNELESLRFLRGKRSNGVKVKDFGNVKSFLTKIEYKPIEEGCLSNLEVKYLTGEWFEEYIGVRLKEELNLENDKILIGAEIRKSISQSEDGDQVKKLLGGIELSPLPKNELDVMFMLNGKFHVIECKTSIIDTRKVPDKTGKEIDKDENILGETIYKSDALKTKFGLFANSYIFTLTDFKEYIKDDLAKTKQMEVLINRSMLSKIKLIDKEKITSSICLKDLL